MGTLGGTLILLRHGESTANADGLFTGLIDVPLSERGRQEAHHAARLLAATGLHPDVAYCSEQRRTIETLDILVAENVVGADRTHRDWRLDERNYGGLTGLLKTAVAERYGYAQFLEWRRSVDVPPPPMDDAMVERFRSMAPYDRLPPEAVTRTESLRDVERRVRSFHQDDALPHLAAGETVLVVAHGNSLRGYCAVLDALSDEEIRRLNIPTGHPLIYRMEANGAPAVRGGEYADPDAALRAADELRRVGGT